MNAWLRISGGPLAALVTLLTGCGADSPDMAGPRAAPTQLVELAEVQRLELSHVVERTGTLRPLRQARIHSQEEGAVLRVAVREGDLVARDQVLVELDGRLLAAGLAKAEARREQTQADVQRLQRLARSELVSEDSLRRARTDLRIARAEERLLRTRLSYMTVRAPFDGVIAARQVNEGDVVSKHVPLVTVIDPGSLVMDVNVSELLLPRLAVNDPALVRIDALGMARHAGRILRIYPTVDPNSRRGRVEILLEPVPAGASAGQFGRVTLSTRRASQLVVPLAALRRDGKGEYVFRLRSDQTAERVAVRTGLRLETNAEVLSGLEVGDRVVRAGFLGLSPGDKVTPVEGEAPTEAQGAGPSAVARDAGPQAVRYGQ